MTRWVRDLITALGIAAAVGFTAAVCLHVGAGRLFLPVVAVGGVFMVERCHLAAHNLTQERKRRGLVRVRDPLPAVELASAQPAKHAKRAGEMGDGRLLGDGPGDLSVLVGARVPSDPQRQLLGAEARNQRLRDLAAGA